MLRQGSESLAGRILYHRLDGFALDEIDDSDYHRLWMRGGFPRSYLAQTDGESADWRRGFVATFLERDLPQLGISIRSTTLNRFWQMLCHYHGQTWNASEFARSFGVADTTVRNYLDTLTGAMVVRQLQPWHENISKRQVKAPKIYLEDSGILHSLLNLPSLHDLEGHPKIGASWEGFAIQQITRRLRARRDECFFWATYGGAELDLLVVRGRQKLGFEIKRTSSPRIMPSMRNAIKDLKLDRLDLVHAGDETYPLSNQIRAVSFARILQDLEPL
jgi:predicted AAA+ superfamily ATPase